MRQLPISHSDFAYVRRNGYYYVDKSLLIRDIIDSAGVCLITRPRRFGKTLNLGMLRYFYTHAEDYRDCFEGLKIMQTGERYLSKMGQHPVIYLSLKEVRQDTWEEAWKKMREKLAQLCEEFSYLRDWPQASPLLHKLFEDVYRADVQPVDLSFALQILSKHLKAYHGQPVVILIDEYDAPAVASYLGGYYRTMIEFLRDFLSEGLKDNKALEKGVLTGIMRIAKESIFSGLNNLDTFTVLTPALTSHFGFTIPEVEQILRDYELNGEELAGIHRWYNGYNIGGVVLFNPWSIIQFVDKPQSGLRSYWAETSTNNLLKRLFFGRGANIENELETLVRGEALRKVISDSLIYAELEHRKEAVWALLLSAGYLKAEDPQKEGEEGLETSYALSIPNLEIKSVYYRKIREWVREVARDDQLDRMLRAIREVDSYVFEETLAHFSLKIFSYHDTQQPEPESFYHAFLLGLLVNFDGEYRVLSNRESGYGRFDILLKPLDKSRTALVIELKSPRVRRGETIEHALQDAAQQLREKRYDTDLRAEGYAQVAQWAIGIYGKDLLVEEVETD